MQLKRRYISSVPILFEREEDSDSNTDCLTCESVPACPTCKSGEQCALTTQTCKKCPETYCLAISEQTNSGSTTGLDSAQVAGIAGALSGLGFLILLVVLYFLWKKYKDKLVLHSRYGDERKNLAYGEEELEDLDQDFDNDHNAVDQRQHKRLSQASGSTMANSVLTRASNVINVAYIPGVTARQQYLQPSARASLTNKANSVHSKETYLSDLDDVSFHGGQVASKAVHPTLVNFNEDSYNYDEHEDEATRERRDVQQPRANFGAFSFKFQRSGPVHGMQGDVIDEEEEETSSGDDTGLNVSSVTETKRPKVLTRYGSLKNKFQTNGINSSSSSSSSDESDSDSDEENIEYITKQHQEGVLDLDSLNFASSKSSTIKGSLKNQSSFNTITTQTTPNGENPFNSDSN